MEKSIQLNIASRGLYVLILFATMAGAVLMTLFFSFQIFEPLNYKPNQLIFISIFGLIWYLLDKVTKNLYKGKVELQLNKEGVHIVWLENFLLHKKRNETVKWEEIRDYMYQPEQYFDLFRIRLHNKKKIKFSLDEKNEEFYFFYLEFEEFIKELNASNQNIQINRAKTIYETTYGLVMAVILGSMLIAIILLLIFVKPKNPSVMTYSYLGVTFIGGLFYIFQVYRMRKSNKENSR